MLDRAKPGLIAVNSAAAASSMKPPRIMILCWPCSRVTKTTPSIPAWLICDATFITKYGLGVVYPGHRNPGNSSRTVISSVLARLRNSPARLTSIAVQLRDTVARYNGFAETGVDVDFGKGETELNRFNGDATTSPTLASGR